MGEQKSQLIVYLRPDMLSRFEAAAQQNGQDIGTWVQKILLDALPATIPSVSDSAGASGRSVMDAAFSALDASEIQQVLPVSAPGVMPLAPEVHESQRPEPQPVPVTPYFFSEHPCVHLMPIVPSNYKPDQTSGQCRTRGGICFRSAQAARSCSDYSPKRVKIRVG